MNGPANHQYHEDKIKGMYKLKKAYQIPEDIPTAECMYKVKPLPPGIGINSVDCASHTNGQENLSSSTGSSKQGKQNISKTGSTPEVKMGKKKGPTPVAASEAPVPSESTVTSLEERQLEIIKKLERLRDVITEIHSSSLLSQDASRSEPSHAPDFTDVVINADPRSPPYSIIFFKKLFSKFCGYNVSLTTHLHSSCKQAVPSNLQVFNSPSDAETQFNVTLIWRTMDHNCDLMVSPIHQTPIRGEANICRFLSRLLPEKCGLNYDSLDLESLFRVEEKLDDIPKLTLEKLEESLRHAQPFILGELSLADLLYYSEAATQLLQSGKNVQSYPNISSWLKNCQVFGDLNVLKM